MLVFFLGGGVVNKLFLKSASCHVMANAVVWEIMTSVDWPTEICCPELV